MIAIVLKKITSKNIIKALKKLILKIKIFKNSKNL